MSDMQALYDMLAMCKVSNQETTSKAAPLGGTFWERLAESLEGYQMTQIDKSISRGLHLHKMMLADDERAAQLFSPPRKFAKSDFSDVEALHDNGYHEVKNIRVSQALMCMRIGVVLDILGHDPDFSEDTGNNTAIYHDLPMPECTQDGLYYPPTNAIFMQVINPKDGAIVAYENMSPPEANRLACRPRDLDVPDLKHWSDVAFLQWKLKATEDSELRYVLRYNVLNVLTESVVKSIHTANATETLPWPGTSYSATSLEGQALLGTPNGSSVAYLLIQHKQELGHKTVDKITVFRKDRELMLLFHIVNVEAQAG